MVLRDSLKAGVISNVYMAERVNGCLKAKVIGQGVGSGSRAWMGRVRMGGRFGGEVEWRASRGVRSCVNG